LTREEDDDIDPTMREALTVGRLVAARPE